MSKKPKNKPQNNIEKNNVEKKTAHFELRHIKPLTPNQERVFNAYNQGYHLMLHGFAGTGKTFCALYLALNELLTKESVYNK